ncbi:MAG: branched-chain amino acid ABC transporter permease [Halobacteriales archaeon]
MIDASADGIVLLVDVLDRLSDPGTLARIAIEGLGKASVYLIISVGLTLIFGLMGVLNFAHGAMAMLGAYLGGIFMLWTVSGSMGAVTVVALFFVAMAVVGAAIAGFGTAIEVKLVRRIYDRTPMYQILLTFGVALILEEMTRILATYYGVLPESQWSEAMGTIPAVLDDRHGVFGAQIRGLYAFEIILGIVAAIGVYLFLTRTLYGLYIRAGSEDAEMAQALGIDVRRAFTVVFGLGTGLAAVGGVLLMWDPLWGPTVHLNIDVLLYAFVVVIIGGLGSYKGTVAAALIVGLADSLTTWVFDAGIVDHPGLPAVTIFLLLVVMLMLRPQGLFGIEEVGGH